jgi:hypothetical protein
MAQVFLYYALASTRFVWFVSAPDNGCPIFKHALREIGHRRFRPGSSSPDLVAKFSTGGSASLPTVSGMPESHKYCSLKPIGIRFFLLFLSHHQLKFAPWRGNPAVNTQHKASFSLNPEGQSGFLFFETAKQFRGCRSLQTWGCPSESWNPDGSREKSKMLIGFGEGFARPILRGCAHNLSGHRRNQWYYDRRSNPTRDEKGNFTSGSMGLSAPNSWTWR